MLTAVEQAMNECNWPESDKEKTTAYDIVEQVDISRTRITPSSPTPPEERERRELRKAEKELDMKAANMTPLSLYYLKNHGVDEKVLSSSDDVAVSEWTRVINVIYALHGRAEQEPTTSCSVGCQS